WLSSGPGLRSRPCANSSPNSSPIPTSSVASAIWYRGRKTATRLAPTRIRSSGIGCPTSVWQTPAEHGELPSSPVMGGPCSSISPTPACWRLRWPISKTGSPSPRDGQQATCRPRLCWCAQTVMWRGRRHHRRRMSTNFVACSCTGSASDPLLRTGGGDVFVHRCRGFDSSVGGRRGGDAGGAGRHDEVLRKAIETHGGWLFKHTGDGVCAAFASPRRAVDAAVAAQRKLKLR